MTKFQVRPGSQLSQEDAQALGEEAERIVKAHGHVTPALVVDRAKLKDSLIHGLFEWNNKIAGHSWRLHQARIYLSDLEEIVVKEGEPVRSFVSIHMSDHHHEPIRKVLVDDEKLAQVSCHLYRSMLGYVRSAKAMGLDQKETAWKRIIQAVEQNEPMACRLEAEALTST